MTLVDSSIWMERLRRGLADLQNLLKGDLLFLRKTFITNS